MNRRSPKCRKAVAFASENWSKYIAIEEFHKEWLWSNATLLELNKGEKVTDLLPTFVPTAFYLVEGLIARSTEKDKKVKFPAKNKKVKKEIKNKKEKKVEKERKLISICQPANLILNTSNIHSKTPLKSDIVALKRSMLLYVPHHKIIPHKEADPVFGTYINVLREKKLKQMRLHTELLQEPSATKRFVKFTQLLPEIYRATIQKEQAEYLEISRSTVAFAQKHLL